VPEMLDIAQLAGRRKEKTITRSNHENSPLALTASALPAQGKVNVADPWKTSDMEPAGLGIASAKGHLTPGRGGKDWGPHSPSRTTPTAPRTRKLSYEQGESRAARDRLRGVETVS